MTEKEKQDIDYAW